MWYSDSASVPSLLLHADLNPRNFRMMIGGSESMEANKDSFRQIMWSLTSRPEAEDYKARGNPFPYQRCSKEYAFFKSS